MSAPWGVKRAGLAIAVVLVVLAGCRSRAAEPVRGPAREGPIAADSDRFPHALHTGNDPTVRGFQGRGLGCADCHSDESYKPPGAFCRNCHVELDPARKGASPLQPYPERGLKRVLASVFSHRLHLDAPAMEQKVGFHVDCADCHTRQATSRDPEL